MDRVRFGRALGFGARQAVKTLVAAADAATAEDPSAKGRPAASTTSAARTVAYSPAAAHAVKTVAQVRQAQQGVGRGSRRFGNAIWGRFVRLSGVVWLEVCGVFFGIFALLALGYLWKLRGAWHAGATSNPDHRALLGAVAMFGLFGYFCITSFMRARRRERGQ